MRIWGEMAMKISCILIVVTQFYTSVKVHRITDDKRVSFILNYFYLKKLP